MAPEAPVDSPSGMTGKTRSRHTTVGNDERLIEEREPGAEDPLATYTCTGCFFSVRSASVVPRRRRRERERAPKNGTKGTTRIFSLSFSPAVADPPPSPAGSRSTLASRRTLAHGRHTVGDTILSTDTCRGTSVSPSVSLLLPAPSVPAHPPVFPLLRSLALTHSLSAPPLALLPPAGVSPSPRRVLAV